jgi:transcriptional regulator with GAF, ATPase, and Fis domain
MIAPPAADLERLASRALLETVDTVFETLGRGLVYLDAKFRVVHLSEGLDRLLGDGAAARLLGRKVEEVLGSELFGEEGSMRHALAAGERREGWGTTVHLPPLPPRPVSLTGAPVCRALPSVCHSQVAYLLVLRPSDEDPQAAGGSPATIVSGLVGRSASMLAIFRLVRNLAQSEATALITGESGTGKELIARALHVQSPRAGGPFVAVNCAALPGELLESELFGHVRGAFTGAVEHRVGRFELAAQGSLFLDEVGDLPLSLQVKLLRVLQERTFERVGESRSLSSRARVIAATNRDLRREIALGRFREDLYYRLRVMPIEVPPLRQRREDIEPLARHLLARVGARYGRSLILAPDAVRALLRYPWPGNVRELENALEFAVAVTKGQTLHRDTLPPEILAPPSCGGAPRPEGERPAANPGATTDPSDPVGGERRRLQAVLEAHRWRRDEAARSLGMSRTTLWRRMRELGLGSQEKAGRVP